MPSAEAGYRAVRPVLVRATTDPGDLDHLTVLDFSDPAAVQEEGLPWLAKLWSRPDVREAVALASPDLAARVDQVLDANTGPGSAKTIRRAVLSVASYLLRWQRRATPFGLFAGVTAAAVGPTAGHVGDCHTVLARADADWLARLVGWLEQQRDLRPRLMVAADSAGVVRDGRFIVAEPPLPDERAPGALREVSARHTTAVQITLASAARPIRFDELTAKICAYAPAVAADKIVAMLHSLVDRRLLITNLRPPSTIADALGHVIEALRAAGGECVPDVGSLMQRLTDIHEQLARHNSCGSPHLAASIRAEVSARMAALVPGCDQVLAIDVRLDGDVSIPQCVLAEAALAANVMLRLTTQPFGSAAWLDYHARFRDRYGPGALVPVRDLVADSGLGYPPGYLGAPRARPTWRMLTQRDGYLLALLQKAAISGADEVELTNADIEALTIGDHATAVAPHRIELGVALHAASAAAVDRGDFELRITGAPRAHTSMAGRFAYLLDEADRAQLAQSYSTDDADVVAVQLSFPPRRIHNDNVTRVGRLLPNAVSISEHPDSDVIGIDDLAVTADADQMFLVQLSTGRRIAPQIPHALDTTVQSPPLARFLAEIADARSAMFGPFDLGAAARTLPYTPRIRYRRIVLAAARWQLTETELANEAQHHTVGDDGWGAALVNWRRQWRVPARVVACHGELRLPLDLEHPLDQALLRTRLHRAKQIELREAEPPDADGWIGRPAELLIPMTWHAPTGRELPITSSPGQIMRPGASAVVHAQLLGNPARFDEILTGHLPAFIDDLTSLGVQRWWTRRHRDTIRLDTDQHIAVFLRLADPAAYGPIAARLAEFAAGLHERGLPSQFALAAHHQQPARYGHGPALMAAEVVWATDTTAALTQIAMAESAGVSAQALAAASMAQLAAGFATDTRSGYRTLLARMPQQPGPVDRSVSDDARRLGDPTGDFAALRALPGGEAVAAAWHVRHSALRAYHHTLRVQRDPATVLRTLLHEHHVRAVGVDPEYEEATVRLARAAVMRCLALAGKA